MYCSSCISAAYRPRAPLAASADDPPSLRAAAPARSPPPAAYLPHASTPQVVRAKFSALCALESFDIITDILFLVTVATV